METVVTGYRFLLVSQPPPTKNPKNNRSVRDNPNFTWAELLRLEWQT